MVAEWAVFGPLWGALLRFLMSRRFKDRLHALDGQLDAPFYIRQFAHLGMRQRVARAPLLHYLMYGWQENRPPRPNFDPIFYRQTNPDVASEDALWHYLTVGAARSAPCNEIVQHAEKRPWQAGWQTVLTIHHGRGGGSSRFLDLFEQELWLRGRNILRLRAVYGSPTLAVIEDRAVPSGEAVPSQVFDLTYERSKLIKFARERGVTRLLVNHLIDRPAAMKAWIEDMGRALECPYDVILHDYYVLCPRVDMVNGRGRFCGVAPPKECVRCVAEDGSEVRDVEPLTWRDTFWGFLAGAGTIFVPSQDVAQRIASHVPGTIQVWLPENDFDLPPERRHFLTGKDPLRVTVLGALNVPKGLRVVASLAQEAKRAGAPLSLTVVGPASDPALLADEGVTVTGAYADQDVDRLLSAAAPHVIFLPAIWPETWSFVLTMALKRGFPVVAFDIGAPSERLRRLSRGRLLALDLAERPTDLLAAFLSLRDELVMR